MNLASRHESSGVVGGINVSKATYLLTKEYFDFEERGPVVIKGKERLDMYRLVGLKQRFVDMPARRPNEAFLSAYDGIRGGRTILGYDS